MLSPTDPHQEQTVPNPDTQTGEVHHLTDTEQFIKRVFDDNPDQGFTLLFRRYHAVLCNHATRYVWDKTVAQDIVSEVFLNFWKNQEFTQITSSYRAYLFRAVRNGCYNYLTRELSRKAPIEGLENVEIDWQRPDQIVQFDELQHKIETTIAQLPPQCKRVFLLNRFEGKKYQEIAEELGISLKTVEMHISKALQHLRKALKEEWLLLLALFFFFST
jgi:RNA polymerase sigma-70 factor (family 1)